MWSTKLLIIFLTPSLKNPQKPPRPIRTAKKFAQSENSPYLCIRQSPIRRSSADPKDRREPNRLKGVMLEWLKRHAWKACIRQKRIASSNLAHSATNFLREGMSITDIPFILLVMRNKCVIPTTALQKSAKICLIFSKNMG